MGSGAVVTDRSTAERTNMGIDEIQKTLGIDPLSFQGERKAESSEKSSAFSKILGEKQQKCPYSHLAKDGLIRIWKIWRLFTACGPFQTRHFSGLYINPGECLFYIPFHITLNGK